TPSPTQETGFMGWSLSRKQQERQQNPGHELHQGKPVAPNHPRRMRMGSIHAEGVQLSGPLQATIAAHRPTGGHCRGVLTPCLSLSMTCFRRVSLTRKMLHEPIPTRNTGWYGITSDAS